MLKIKIKQFKVVFWITFSLLVVFAFTPRGYAQALDSSAGETVTFPYKQQFIISGYYTPLPNQTRYVTGSFEGDVRLNGEGVHAADGTLVYPGLAAAPKNFPFGTKMEIPGFGIVAVHDRGGAIKNSRLDIWLGSGEEGMRRALGWGMRTIEVTVYGIDPNIKESVNFTDIPLANLTAILPRMEHFKSDLGLGDEGDGVFELQRFLAKLGYFHVEPTGYFGEETQEAVLKFQLENGVIPNADDKGARNFGPKSRAALEDMLEAKKAEALGKLSLGTIARGEKSDQVKKLQEVLYEYGYLKELSGAFDESTFDALVRFQLDAGVITKRGDRGAGFYGPKTRSALEDVIASKYTPKMGRLIAAHNLRPVSGQLFTEPLARDQRGEEVEKLQEELRRLNFLALKPTGYYGAFTEHAVLKFQQATGIIDNVGADGAGIAGPKTLEKLNELAQARKSQRILVLETTEKKAIVAERVGDEKVLLAGATPSEMFSADLAYGLRGNDVERLQKVMKRLGFFPGKITTLYYGDITKQSVIAFQKSHAIPETGNFDQDTRKILNRILTPSLPS